LRRNGAVRSGLDKGKVKEMRIFRNSVSVTVVVIILLALFALAFGGVNAEGRVESRSAGLVEQKLDPGTYSLDPAHTHIGFGVEHLGIALVKGRFKDVQGTIEYDPKDISRSKVNFLAKIESIDTGVTARDDHLRSADFFDAAKHPTMTFVSTKIEKKGKRFIMIGDLTIKGVTQPIAFEFTFTDAIKDPWGGTRFGASASTTINRRDFGITYGNALPGGGFDVADRVAIELHLEAVRAK
jgi:polyisoprenoid-binding protein YceI